MSVFTFHNSSPLPSPHLLLRAANYPSSIRSAIAYPSIEAESIVRSSTCLRFYSLSYCCPPPIAATLDILPSFLLCSFLRRRESKKKKEEENGKTMYDASSPIRYHGGSVTRGDAATTITINPRKWGRASGCASADVPPIDLRLNRPPILRIQCKY